jgi:hypothetical protein
MRNWGSSLYWKSMLLGWSTLLGVSLWIANLIFTLGLALKIVGTVAFLPIFYWTVRDLIKTVRQDRKVR